MGKEDAWRGRRRVVRDSANIREEHRPLHPQPEDSSRGEREDEEEAGPAGRASGSGSLGSSGSPGPKTAVAMKTPKTPSVSLEGLTSAGEEAVRLRPYWTSSRHFLYSCLSTSLSFGGVGLLPIFLEEYGGAFVVATLLLMLTVQMPLAVLEAGLGQFHSAGPLHVFRHVLPLTEGLGLVTLAFSAFYGLSSGVYAARLVYLIFAGVAGNGLRCVDPQREPGQNSPVCLTTKAIDACTYGPRPETWLVGGACQDGQSLDCHYLPLLEQCLRNASAGPHALKDLDTDRCAVSLSLFLNASSPQDFFQHREGSAFAQRLSTRARRAADPELSCVAGLFEERLKCSSRLAAVDLPRWDRRADPLTEEVVGRTEERHFYLDLMGWEKAPEVTRRRAACLHLLLQESLYSGTSDCGAPLEKEAVLPTLGPRPRVARSAGIGVMGAHCPPSVLACLLRDYCRRTWPEETGLSRLGCLHRVLVPRPSLSTMERDRIVYLSMRTDALRWKWQMPFCLAMVWPQVVTFTAGGIQRIGQLSWLTGAAPMAANLAQTPMGFFRHTLHYGIRRSWDFRLCKLLQPDLWIKASAFNFYNFCLGKGNQMSLASYNRFHQDVLRDVVVLGLTSMVSSLLLGMATMGLTNEVARVIHSDSQHLLGSLPIFSFMVQGSEEASIFLHIIGSGTMSFFVFTAAISSVVTLCTAVTDEWPELRARWRELVGGVSLLLCFAGVPYASDHGATLLRRHLRVVEGVLTPLAQLLLLVPLAYVYGARRLLVDLRMMADGGPAYRRDSHYGTGRALLRGLGRWYLMACWTVLSPLGLGALVVVGLWKETWPAWVLSFLVLAVVTGCLLYSRFRRGVSGLNLGRPALDWGPERDEDRTGRYSAQHVLYEAAIAGRGHLRLRSPGDAVPVALFRSSRAQQRLLQELRWHTPEHNRFVLATLPKPALSALPPSSTVDSAPPKRQPPAPPPSPTTADSELPAVPLSPTTDSALPDHATQGPSPNSTDSGPR